MSNAEKQQEEESDVFAKFAGAYPFSSSITCIKSRNPPEPDILCGFNTGGKIAFELVQAEDVADVGGQGRNPMLVSTQYLDTQIGTRFDSVSPSIVNHVKKKLSKKYKTDFPIHLLVYSRTTCVNEKGHWESRLESLLEREGMGPFEKIWVFNHISREIVGAWP